MKPKEKLLQVRMSADEREAVDLAAQKAGVSTSEFARRRLVLPREAESDPRMDRIEARMLYIEGDLSRQALYWKKKYQALVANEKLKAERLASIDHVEGRSVAKLIVGGVAK